MPLIQWLQNRGPVAQATEAPTGGATPSRSIRATAHAEGEVSVSASVVDLIRVTWRRT